MNESTYAEQEALIKAVNDSPLDATPRMVYADWLDEHDKPREAAIQRVLAEPHSDAHRLNYADRLDEEEDAFGVGFKSYAEFIRIQIRHAAGMKALGKSRPIFGSAEHLTALQVGVDTDLVHHWMCKNGRKWFAYGNCFTGTYHTRLFGSDITAEVRRGFIETVWCSEKDWLGDYNGARFHHPITRVCVTGNHQTFTKHPGEVDFKSYLPTVYPNIEFAYVYGDLPRSPQT